MFKSDFTSSNPRKPTQFEPIPSEHVVKIIDWIARLASDTANFVLSITTTIASSACAIYGPVRANTPSYLSVSQISTTMKCQG